MNSTVLAPSGYRALTWVVDVAWFVTTVGHRGNQKQGACLQLARFGLLRCQKNMKEPSDIEKTCEALHKINKHAKKYAGLADDNYRRGKKATARLNSLKKKALYSLKSKVLRRLYNLEYHDRIEVHDINDRDYYCFYFEDWSFHAPVDDWSGSHPAKQEISRSKSIENFSAGTESSTDMSLKAALLYLNDEFGFNPNKHLEEEKVSYGHRSYFAGWDYLR